MNDFTVNPHIVGNSMFDIHCHILPGVDDGSGNTSDSIEMARLAHSSGVLGIIATPHCNLPGVIKNYWSDDMSEKVDRLQQKFRQLGIPVSVYPGQEVFLSSGYLEMLRMGKLIGLNRSAYLLVEFAMEEDSREAYRKLQQITAEGYTPVVAHPERYGFVQEQKDAPSRIKEVGGLLQLNKGSIKGSFGTATMETAHRILRRHQADFVASDAHSQYRRTPYLAEIHEMISECYSFDYADLLLKVNPSKVIENSEIFRD
ncbi:MAG: tyrosine-protein phosphatase [Eubacteriales bacterium]